MHANSSKTDQISIKPRANSRKSTAALLKPLRYIDNSKTFVRSVRRLLSCIRLRVDMKSPNCLPTVGSCLSGNNPLQVVNTALHCAHDDIVSLSCLHVNTPHTYTVPCAAAWLHLTITSDVRRYCNPYRGVRDSTRCPLGCKAFQHR